MSVLIHESAINPDKNLWALSGANGGAKSATGTGSGGTLINSIPINIQTSVNSYTSSLPGTYVIYGSFQWTSAGGTPQMYGAVIDLTSGSIADTTVTQPTGVTSQNYSGSCVLTLPNVSSVNLKQTVQVTVIGISCRVQWSVLYFPA